MLSASSCYGSSYFPAVENTSTEEAIVGTLQEMEAQVLKFPGPTRTRRTALVGKMGDQNKEKINKLTAKSLESIRAVESALTSRDLDHRHTSWKMAEQMRSISWDLTTEAETGARAGAGETKKLNDLRGKIQGASIGQLEIAKPSISQKVNGHIGSAAPSKAISSVPTDSTPKQPLYFPPQKELAICLKSKLSKTIMTYLIEKGVIDAVAARFSGENGCSSENIRKMVNEALLSTPLPPCAEIIATTALTIELAISKCAVSKRALTWELKACLALPF